MLCLSRRLSQTVRIASDIEVKVLQLNPFKVRLGIVAPRGIPVHRQEIFDLVVAKGDVIPSVGAMVEELEQLRTENAQLRLALAKLEAGQ